MQKKGLNGTFTANTLKTHEKCLLKLEQICMKCRILSNHVDLLAIHLEIHLGVICIYIYNKYIVSCRLFIVFPISQTIDP